MTNSTPALPVPAGAKGAPRIVTAPAPVPVSPGWGRYLELAFDLAAFPVAWLGTIELRLLLNPWLEAQFARDTLWRLAPPLNLMLLLWLLTSVWFAAAPTAARWTVLNAMRLPEKTALAAIVAIVAAFFSHELGLDFSRSFVLLFIPVTYFVFLAARLLEEAVFRTAIEKFSRLAERVAVVGDGSDAKIAIDRLRAAAETGAVRLAGVVTPAASIIENTFGPARVLGNVAQLPEVVNRERLTRIIVVNDGSLSDEEIQYCTETSRRMGVVMSEAVAMVHQDRRLHWNLEFGMHLLEMRPVTFTRRQEAVKRACDLIFATLSLLAVAPVLLLAAALIKITSKGPVFYRALRVGKGGRHFEFLKLRSMYWGPEAVDIARQVNRGNGHVFKRKADPRITPVGRWLRRTSIDELPQLINVIRCEMSLVGPRPLPAEDLEPDGTSRSFSHWSAERAKVAPGITGLWQVRGRSDLSFEQMTELDLEYLQNWSLWLDLEILLATPLAVVTGRGAY
jgi:exopolysaccharide biosynthesis polyprenyl glycosylphosphotransferase